ncbi:hypothetical protein PIB30_069712 [Stylosanthes scabra]|uniref:Uncharacterized protein n=1 Tax=Stylosanthes scabra TaxID=79078 RepID=A0ABU6TNS1_9FABA|nr:hypothetical protein [Stylosanthes scabra]
MNSHYQAQLEVLYFNYDRYDDEAIKLQKQVPDGTFKKVNIVSMTRNSFKVSAQGTYKVLYRFVGGRGQRDGS